MNHNTAPCSRSLRDTETGLISSPRVGCLFSFYNSVCVFSFVCEKAHQCAEKAVMRLKPELCLGQDVVTNQLTLSFFRLPLSRRARETW